MLGKYSTLPPPPVLEIPKMREADSNVFLKYLLRIFLNPNFCALSWLINSTF
jgi:hypothetical protein